MDGFSQLPTVVLALHASTMNLLRLWTTSWVHLFGSADGAVVKWSGIRFLPQS